MKLLIAIPSKKRVDVLRDNALRWVSKLNIDWQVFVEPQDYAEYNKIISSTNLLVIGDNNRGLGYAKNEIKSYAAYHGYTHIFKVDDDVKGFTNYRRVLPLVELPDFISRMLHQIDLGFEYSPQIKAVGFPYKFELYEQKKWEVVKRLQTAYVCRTEDFHADPAISVFEDFASALSIIVNGGLVMRYGLAGIDMGVRVGGGQGDHQSFDRKEQALKELDLLRKIYPPLNFRQVDKPWGIEPDISSITIPRRT